MRLRQGQIWKQGEEYLRVVSLQRRAVEYKSMMDPKSKDGTHHHATKKEFCRLLKNAVLLEPAEIPKA